jgi:Fibronectin type III domain
VKPVTFWSGLAALVPAAAIAQAPIASSSFAGAEDPLVEGGAWTPLTSLSPNGGRFQKNNGAFPDRFSPDHAGARTTAVVPADHYSEIVVGHLGTSFSNVGPTVRVQTAGASIDSHYLWWASLPNGLNNLYRIDANGTSYRAGPILATSPVTDGDRIRLIARGLVIYGIRNGVRDFIYNTGPDATKYASGASGMLAFSGGASLTDATIASWSTGPAPASSGTHDSSNFIGVENPLDEGDRWYPLPGYSGFRKAGGLAIGRDFGHNASGVWSIAPPARQYSEVTLGTAASGGGGPIVRIDRNASGQTGWMLFLWADNPAGGSGIYKLNPDGTFTLVRQFVPLIVSGDKWRLTANGSTLEVFRNGVSQFTYTTDGSYPAGDVGIEALSPAFTFAGWEGGDLPLPPPDTQPPTAPGALTAVASSGSQINLMWTAASDNVGVTGYLVERCQGAGCTAFAQIAAVNGTSFSDTGLLPNTTYGYRVRATDAAGNLGPYSNGASATTLPF